MSHRLRVGIATIALAAGVMAAAPLLADNYPNRPVTIIVASTAGGGTVDITTGIVTGGSGGTATFQFDVPVRFDIDQLEVEIQDFAMTEFASPEVLTTW